MTMHIDEDEVRRLLRLEPLLEAVRRALIDLSAGSVVQLKCGTLGNHRAQHPR